MSILDSIIAAISPAMALRRQTARLRLHQATRLYDSIASSNYRPRRGSSASADATMQNAQHRLREYARWLDENHDIAIGVLDDLVSNIVGVGVGIEPMAKRADEPASDINDQLRELWGAFWEKPETTQEIPGPELERLVCRSWLRDGEIFVQHVSQAPGQYQLQPLEADFVPFDLFSQNENTIHGVIKDRLGKPVGYHVYKVHPGHVGLLGNVLTARMTYDTVVVGAANMSHLKFVRRLHQTRGVSLMHGVFTRLDDLKDYEESERVAAHIAASFSAYIKKPDMGDSLVDSATHDRLMEMSPGMIFDNLLPGEDVGVIDAKRPNNDVGNYIHIQERRIAAGTGSRRSAIARDYNGTYSAQRQELVEGAVHYRRLHNYLVHVFYLPVWRRFVDAARIRGELRIPQNIDIRSLYRPEIRQQPLPWIDPLKEVQAHGLAVERGFRSRHQVIRDLGGDPRDVDTQLAADDFDVRPTVPVERPSEDDDGKDEMMEDAA